uniref:SAM domain-containing protein n=1 Tax=Macrostomum lignano TaxID=282301 RepID=A0A1I8GHI8_9PLAT
VAKLHRQLNKQRKRVQSLQQQQQQQQQFSSGSTVSLSTQTEPGFFTSQAMPSSTLSLMKLSIGNVSAAESSASGPEHTAGGQQQQQPSPSIGSAVWIAEQFLPSLGLRQFSAAFQSAGIDLSRLLSLDKRQLAKLDQQYAFGLSRRRHRRSLLMGVELLRRLRCDWDSLERLRSRAWAAIPLLFWSNANLAQWLASAVGCVAKPGVTDDTSGLHGALLVWSSDWQHLLSDAVKHHHQQQQSSTVADALADMDRLVRESLAMRPDEIEDCVISGASGSSIVSGGASRQSVVIAATVAAALPARAGHDNSSGVDEEDEEQHLVDLSTMTFTEQQPSQQHQQQSRHKQPP